MSFLVGSTKARSNVNEEAQGLYSGLSDYLGGKNFGPLNTNGQIDPAMLEPYQKMFRDQNAQTFGQAKEAGGTLTGSGLSNALGIAGQRASTEQGAFLANLIEQKRQREADRYSQLYQGALNSQAAGVQYTHQPGFLDYAFQGAAAAAPFIAGPAGAAVAGGLNKAQQMAQSGFGVSAPATLPQYNSPIVQGEWGGGPTNGQLGQASFYKFLQPGDPLYATEGQNMGSYLYPQLFGSGRDAFRTAPPGQRRYF